MARRVRRPAQRLRFAVDALPRRTREAMLRGIDANTIIVGAYQDSGSGGICPMLAAHRNGGRTSVASFARAWDAYTGAKRPRVARPREIRMLRALLEQSLIESPSPVAAIDERPLSELAAEIRAEREAIAARAGAALPAPHARTADEPTEREVDRTPAGPPADTGERSRISELRTRLRWSWLRPVKSYDEYRDLLAAASEEMSEQRAAELVGEPQPDARHRVRSLQP